MTVGPGSANGTMDAGLDCTPAAGSTWTSIERNYPLFPTFTALTVSLDNHSA